MSNVTFKLFADKMSGTNISNYIGTKGEIFYDRDYGALRISDGHTIGGSPIHIHAESVVYDHNIVPTEDDTYTLGSQSLRWKEIFIGPGSLYITDKTLGTNAALTVDSGVLQINGANQLQVGQLKFVDNAIESISPDIDIQIGLTTSTAALVLNRTTKIAKPLLVGDTDSGENNIVVNGTLYDSQVTITDYGSSKVGQLMLHRHSTTVQPIIVAALSNSDDDSQVDIGYGQPIFQISATAAAGDDYKEFANIVFSSEDMDGVTIGQNSSPGKILFNVVPDGDTHTNTAIAIRHDCTVEFSNGLILNPSQVPSTSKGNPGDRSGMFAIDMNNIYYCIENYSTGTVNIWKKTPLTGGTW